MKKTILLLGGFLALSSMTASAQSSQEKVRPSDTRVLKSTEVKQNPTESSQKEFKAKFSMTQTEYNQLSPAKKEYVMRNPELFIITNETN